MVFHRTVWARAETPGTPHEPSPITPPEIPGEPPPEEFPDEEPEPAIPDYPPPPEEEPAPT